MIMEVISEGRAIMRENDNLAQWTNGYPSRSIILNDISRAEAFVCTAKGIIVGYFSLAIGIEPDPNYKVIENGKWLDDKPYGVLHRLASGRKVKGIAQAVFDFAFTKIGNIKVDTHKENRPVQYFLRKYGFTYCGVIYLKDGSPRDAFQKLGIIDSEDQVSEWDELTN